MKRCASTTLASVVMVAMSTVQLVHAQPAPAQPPPAPTDAPPPAPNNPPATEPDPAPLGTKTINPTPAPAPAPAPPVLGTKTEGPEDPSGRPITDEVEGDPKLSLPTEADRQAWASPGFRLTLAGGYGELKGLRGAPSGRLIAAKLRIGVRLDASWSLLTSFEYAQAKRTGELVGLRFLGTVDPTWHVTQNLALSVGFGFGGIVEGNQTGRMDATPLPATLESSYTFPDASTPIARCSGVGAAGLLRADYGIVLGPRTRVSVALEVSGQWTGCVQDTNRFEPDSGEAIVRRQWWPHTGLTLAAGFTWR